MPEKEVTNVVFAGLGGQGIIKASDILSEAVFSAGYDVKKSEIHGMSQRGGSVTSEVRFGPEVFSPMVAAGTAQFMVALDSTQIECAKHVVHPNGLILSPELFLNEGQTLDELAKDPASPVTNQNLNVALLGALSTYLDLPEETWIEALCACLPEKLHDQNKTVFAFGRSMGRK